MGSSVLLNFYYIPRLSLKKRKAAIQIRFEWRVLTVFFSVFSFFFFNFRYSATDALKFVGIERDVDFALR